MSAPGLRLKHVARVDAGQSPPSPDVTPFDGEGTPFLQGNAEFGARYPRAVHRCDLAPRIASKGALLVSVRAPVGAVNTADQRYGIGRGLAAVNPRSIHPRYAYWLLLHSEAWLNSIATGSTFTAISGGDLGDVPVPVAEEIEQRKIADYLDRETAQIDAFIAKNEELIALLAERRAAVIARAVTRGLDEKAGMQESGVATLGLIPAHWTVNRIRNVGRAIIGLTYSPEDICDEDDAGTLVLRAGNIQNGELVFEDCVYVGKAIPKALRLRLGDIVICARNGSARLIGKNAVATSEVVGHTWGAFMAVLRTPINEYLRWVLNSAIFTSSIGAFATSTINQLTSSTLHSLQFAMPPKGEQAAISAYLTEATAATDSAVHAARRAIALARSDVLR